MNKDLQNKIKDKVISYLLNQLHSISSLNSILKEENTHLKTQFLQCLKSLICLKDIYNIDIPLSKLKLLPKQPSLSKSQSLKNKTDRNTSSFSTLLDSPLGRNNSSSQRKKKQPAVCSYESKITNAFYTNKTLKEKLLNNSQCSYGGNNKTNCSSETRVKKKSEYLVTTSSYLNNSLMHNSSVCSGGSPKNKKGYAEKKELIGSYAKYVGRGVGKKGNKVVNKNDLKKKRNASMSNITIGNLLNQA